MSWLAVQDIVLERFSSQIVEYWRGAMLLYILTVFSLSTEAQVVLKLGFSPKFKRNHFTTMIRENFTRLNSF